MKNSLLKFVSGMATCLTAITTFATANDYTCAPQCDVCLPTCNRWFVDSDSLFLNAAEHGLTYGSVTDVVTNTNGTSEYHIKKKNPHHRYDTGLRIGIGYHFDCYDAAVYWTNFDTDAHGRHNVSSTPSSFFTPSFGSITPLLGNTAILVDRASAHWKLRLNLVDVQIGRAFCVNSCLKFKPYIGARGAAIDQKYNITYTAPVGFIGTSNIVDQTRIKSNFEGGGILIGSDVEYNLGCGLSLFGDLAVSLLYGESEIKTKERRTTLLTTEIPSTIIAINEQKDNDRGFQAITDATIGIRWKHTCCNRVVVWDIGWEQHYFFAQNQFEKFTNYAGLDNSNTDRYPQYKRGDLSVQGLVFSSKIEF